MSSIQELLSGKIDGPPQYKPSIDKIFLDKLSESDRYLVTKLDEIDQRIEWAILVAVSDHNKLVDVQNSQHALEARCDALEKKLSITALPTEDRTMLKWVRENVMAPARMLGWGIAVATGAALSYLVEKALAK